MLVSIVIKALNEEANIARAIESCLQALRGIEGEVVLADSLSEDRTVEIASAYPVRIVQFQRREDRGCGAAAQLGFQHARGEFVYLMDGDMALQPGFLQAALAAAAEDSRLAGIGGLVREMQVSNLEFASRAARPRADLQAGEVDRLDGGGLYRRSAIEEVGYLADRNLHGFEEFELATRLRTKGWRLARLDRVAVEHYGYTMNAYRLLWARARSGYVQGAGELTRAALGTPRLAEALRKLRILPLSLAVTVWLASLPAILLLGRGASWAVMLAAAVAVAPFAAMSLRRRSLRLGIYAVALWLVYMVGTLRGFVRPRIPPAEPIPSRILQELPAAGAGQRPWAEAIER